MQCVPREYPLSSCINFAVEIVSVSNIQQFLLTCGKKEEEDEEEQVYSCQEINRSNGNSISNSRAKRK